MGELRAYGDGSYVNRKMCFVVQNHLGKGAFPSPRCIPQGKALSAAAGRVRVRARQGLEWRIRLVPSHLSSRGSWFRGDRRPRHGNVRPLHHRLREPPSSPKIPHGQGGVPAPLEPQTMPWKPTVRRLDARQRVAAGPRRWHLRALSTLNQGCAHWTPATATATLGLEERTRREPCGLFT
jgi:hypothetical protein